MTGHRDEARGLNDMRIALYGAGGFGRQLVAQHRDKIGCVVDDALFGGELLGIPIIHPEELEADAEVIVTISDPVARQAVAAKLRNRLATLIAPTALVGHDCELGAGSVLCEAAIVAGLCRIGRHFQCNFFSYVSHDCAIGDFVTFAPQVCCSGNVTIGDGAYIGTGAMLKPHVTIGRNAVVGMGAVVLKDVPDGATVVGNPARIVSRNR